MDVAALLVANHRFPRCLRGSKIWHLGLRNAPVITSNQMVIGRGSFGCSVQPPTAPSPHLVTRAVKGVKSLIGSRARSKPEAGNYPRHRGVMAS